MPEHLPGNDNTLIVEDPVMHRGFTAVPNALLFTDRLSAAAKLCYAALLHYAWQTARCWPGQERLAADLHVDRSSVKRYLKELADGGFIVVHRRGLTMTNVYSLPSLERVLGLAPPDGSDLSHQDGAPLPHQERAPLPHKYDTEQETIGQYSTPPPSSSSPPPPPEHDDDDVLKTMEILGEPAEDYWWYVALKREHFPGMQLASYAKACFDHHAARNQAGRGPGGYTWKTAFWDWLWREANPPQTRKGRSKPPAPGGTRPKGNSAADMAAAERFKQQLAAMHGGQP